MTTVGGRSHPRWCIVVADACSPDWPVSAEYGAQRAPVQYCGLAEPTTVLQKALHRAARVTDVRRVLVTAAEAHRSHWQDALWYLRAEHRFISESPGFSLLTTAAAVLWIAARAPGALITILPARCYVADEWTLTVALETALTEPSVLADGVVTLGMLGPEPGVDEDYVVPGPPDGRSTVVVAATARRPLAWVARELVRRGALIASHIYIGYAEVLAALLFKYQPRLSHEVLQHVKRLHGRNAEHRISQSMMQEPARNGSRPYWDRAPWLPVRALRVMPCGWSGLHSSAAIERIIAKLPGSIDRGGVDIGHGYHAGAGYQGSDRRGMSLRPKRRLQ